MQLVEVQPGDGSGRNSDWAGRVVVVRIVGVTVGVMVLVWWRWSWWSPMVAYKGLLQQSCYSVLTMAILAILAMPAAVELLQYVC